MKSAFYIRYIRYIRLFSTPEHIFHAITSFLSVGNSAVRKKRTDQLSSIFQVVLNPAREDLGKRAKCRTCGFVDVLGASLVLLNRAEIHPSQLTQLPLSQPVVLSSDLQTGRRRFLKKKKVQKKFLPHKHSKRTNQRHIQPQSATKRNKL